VQLKKHWRTNQETAIYTNHQVVSRTHRSYGFEKSLLNKLVNKDGYTVLCYIIYASGFQNLVVSKEGLCCMELVNYLLSVQALSIYGTLVTSCTVEESRM
jgi:hypothetical protein